MDSKLIDFPTSNPIDLDSFLYVARLSTPSTYIDEKITPRMILNATNIGGGSLSPEVISRATFTPISGKLYIIQNTNASTENITVSTGMHFAISATSANLGFTWLPLNYNIQVQTQQLNQNVDSGYYLQNNGFPSYIEVIAISNNQFIATSAINISSVQFSGTPS